MLARMLRIAGANDANSRQGKAESVGERDFMIANNEDDAPIRCVCGRRPIEKKRGALCFVCANNKGTDPLRRSSKTVKRRGRPRSASPRVSTSFRILQSTADGFAASLVRKQTVLDVFHSGDTEKMLELMALHSEAVRSLAA